MIKFPSIDQFRTCIRAVVNKAQWDGQDENGDSKFNRNADIPKLKFRGAVKLHGTNAAIVREVDKAITYQSRERELTITSDNAGFALYMSARTCLIDSMIDGMINWVNPAWDDVPQTVVVFGEWCGGNIQKGVAINGLPKMFVIFAVKFIYSEERSVWCDIADFKHIVSKEDKIFNILQFGQFDVEIDFAKPHEIQNTLIDLTIKVEEECPAGKFFGNAGIGEGIVWTCREPEFFSSKFWFKTKGEKHSASKVKVLASVDVEAIAALDDFVDMAVTETRLEQGLQNLVNEQLKPFEMASMGDFIRWVFNDVVKEEMDTIVASQINPKKIGGLVANKARKWYIDQFNNKG